VPPPGRCSLGQPADHLRRVGHRVVGAAGINPLRREGEIEVDPGLQARLLEDRGEALAGRAGVGGRFQDDELAGVALGAELGPDVDQIGEVGLALARQGRRNADQDRVAVGQVTIARFSRPHDRGWRAPGIDISGRPSSWLRAAPERRISASPGTKST